MSVSIGNGLIHQKTSWEILKNISEAKVLSLQYEYDTFLDGYFIFAVDDIIVYTTFIFNGTVPETSNFSQEENDSFRLDFKARSNKPVRRRQADGVMQMAQVGREGVETIKITHNFCDPTTWYTNSVRVTDVSLTESDGYTFTSNHVNWINLKWGNMYDEAGVSSNISHGYDVVVKVNGITKTQREPFANSGGDYEIYYKDGYIKFFEDQTGTTVQASYSYATDSTWVLKPHDGKIVDIEQAEAQFSSDMIMNDSIQFEIWVYNPYDLPNKIPYDITEYKKIRNFIDEALGSFPVVPSIGGPTRGTQSDVYGFPFRYGSVRSLKSSQGVELRIKLKNDIAFGGEYATATFYASVRDEV